MKVQLLQRLIVLLGVLCMAHDGFGQRISGQVVNEQGKPLAFATIKFGHSQKGVIADLNGKFEVDAGQVSGIEVSYLNYETQQVAVSPTQAHIVVTLKSAPANLNAVVVQSKTGNKLKRILNNVVANKDRNNPDKYEWYRCHIYYKMAADAVFSNAAVKRDTGGGAKKFNEMMEQQHLLMTETYSRRTFERPSKVQDEVIASRMSGFRKAMFSGLITDVLPFHSYNDFIQLNGRDYKSPVSKGLFRQFNFSLYDEILDGSDTIWIINFKPKQDETELKGNIYIHSGDYAITRLLAQAVDTLLRKETSIEQQYTQQSSRWFPDKLNYVFKMQFGGSDLPIQLTGTSLIDSVSFSKDPTFRFDRAHTTRLQPGADERKDSAWQQLRPQPLQLKEARTYVFMDSIGDKHHFDRLATYGSKLTEGRFPIGKWMDLNTNRLFVYNKYERTRLGLGLQTNEGFSQHFSVGAWAGYGTRDKAWKYGAFAEVYADRYKEFVIGASYSHDISDPGRLQINKEIDRNYLRAFLLTRVDRTTNYSVSIRKKLGYWNAELVAARQEVTPQYGYVFNRDNKTFQSFTFQELGLNLRYAYGELTAPVFGKYYPTPSKYPVAYARLIAGKMLTPETPYLQAVAAVRWQKNVNRFGLERFQLMGGALFAKSALPVSKLFAGNGFANDDNALYVFGGMQTMTPYAYYADRFVNFYWMHDFLFHFYKYKISRNMSSAPRLSLGYNVLWAGLNNIDAHQNIAFKVAEHPYHEAGAMVNGLLRFNLLGLGYGTFNMGYFRHITTHTTPGEHGRVVFGLGMEL